MRGWYRTTSNGRCASGSQRRMKRGEIRSVDGYQSGVREALSILDKDVRKREEWFGQGSAAVVAWIHKGLPVAAAPPLTGPMPGRLAEVDVIAGGDRP